MELNPYIQGVVSAVSYFVTHHSLPKKIKEPIRSIIAIFIAIALSLLIQFIIDCIAGAFL